MEWVTTTTILRRLSDFDDQLAWERFVARFRRPIVAFAREYGLEAADAEDVAQETLAAFAETYRSGRYQRERGRLSSWLFGIAYRQVMRHRRARARLAARAHENGQDVARASEEEAAAAPTWDLVWERAIMEECLRRAQHEFQADTYRLFERSVRDDRPAAAVAEELGVSVKAVYNARHRVLRRLRELRQELESMD